MQSSTIFFTKKKNSAIADKPGDEFVQILTYYEHIPPNMCDHAEFGRSALKVVGTGEPQKLGSAETPLSWHGRRGRPRDTRLSPIVLPRQIW